VWTFQVIQKIGVLDNGLLFELVKLLLDEWSDTDPWISLDVSLFVTEREKIEPSL
jgi:hypothetical protein